MTTYDPLERLIDLIAQACEEDEVRVQAARSRAARLSNAGRTFEQRSRTSRKAWATRIKRAGEHVDEVAVERAVAGAPADLTPNERREATTKLVLEGVSDAEVARRVGCDPQTVLRHRQRNGIESRWAS